MKKNYLPLIFSLLFFNAIAISQEENSKQLPTIITSDFTLKKDMTYTVDDVIQVYNGAILKIEEGVLLKSLNNSNIIFLITEGSKVVALGSYKNPIKAISTDKISKPPVIVMTSSIPKKENTANQFHYININHPTLLINQQPINNTVISSSDTDF